MTSYATAPIADATACCSNSNGGLLEVDATIEDSITVPPVAANEISEILRATATQSSPTPGGTYEVDAGMPSEATGHRLQYPSNHNQQQQHSNYNQQDLNYDNATKMHLTNITKSYSALSSPLNCSEFDCDSLSDGREKTDTTPENIKKIDDVIEREQQLRQRQDQNQQQQQQYMFANNANYKMEQQQQYQQQQFEQNQNSYKNQFVDSSQAASPVTATPTLTQPQSNDRYLDMDADANDSQFGAVRNTKDPHSKVLPNERSAAQYSMHLDQEQEQELAPDNGEQKENSMGASNDDSLTSTATTETAKSNSKNYSYSFTIENLDGKDNNPAATAARYKSMMERFQNRHRRGASMSKLEGTTPTGKESKERLPANARRVTTATAHATDRANQSLHCSQSASTSTTATAAAVTPTTTTGQVKMRARDRSASRVRDASKRHSWSPRSSTQELPHNAVNVTTAAANGQYVSNSSRVCLPPSSAAAAGSQTRKSSAKAVQAPVADGKSVNNAYFGQERATNGMANSLTANKRSEKFMPRSMTMQLALAKVDVSCPHPPLDDDLHVDLEDSVSEAGTYTVYGDNYTEEQKDRMNIDANSRLKRANRPHDLELDMKKVVVENIKTQSQLQSSAHNLTQSQSHLIRPSNVLEVNYYHEDDEKPPQSPSSQRHQDDLILGNNQTGGSYYAKIRARVLRNIANEKAFTASETFDLCSATRELEQLKQHKQSQQQQHRPMLSPEESEKDIGFFTSITTSGVLAKQRALDSQPKLARCSLSTSQIDSSEYIGDAKQQLNAKLTTSAYAATPAEVIHHHPVTDDYRLNAYSAVNQKTRSKIDPATSPEDTLVHNKLSDTAVLKTARTKNDWIREWARNARARSLANDTTTIALNNMQNNSRHSQDNQDLMTRSYTCSLTGGESLTDDNLALNKVCMAKINKTLAERYRLSSGEFDYSSDPSLSTSYAKAQQQQQDMICKPPKSPTKIPSPLHSIGRARNASRTRAPLTNILPLEQQQQLPQPAAEEDDEDVYLQKTAAAINNLQLSLSRKNSLKSPGHHPVGTTSPRAQAARCPTAAYSSDSGSPYHSYESSGGPGGVHVYRGSPRHRRNLSSNDGYARQQSRQQQQLLMTSSFNEQQLQLLTNGEYLSKQLRMRKNSFDSKMNTNSPVRRSTNAHNPVQHPHEQSVSPIRRSSSFSVTKMGHQRASSARPQYQNIYTPPGSRLDYTLSTAAGHHAADAHHPNMTKTAEAIKKSASSNSFRQMYSDYDENLQYYINDEDDYGEDFSISSDGAIDHDVDTLPSPLDDDTYPGHHQHRLRLPQQPQQQLKHADDPYMPNVPLSNTRYNKALLMRIERSKQKVAGGAGGGGGGGKTTSAPTASCGGVMACPNTPELPRRNIKSAPRRVGGPPGLGGGSSRQSMPRDTSLNRLASSQVPNSLASAKRQLLQTAAAAAASPAGTQAPVQSKYLDISKYKAAQGNSFLRKNESKSTLKNVSSSGTTNPGSAPSNSAASMKRSPSSSSMTASGLSRADPTRASNRSVRSVAANMTNSATSLGSHKSNSSRGVRRDTSVSKQKEVEMAMWKRRSTYDPMKAAAEDRRRKEEAKRLSQMRNMPGGEAKYERRSRSHTRRSQL